MDGYTWNPDTEEYEDDQGKPVSKRKLLLLLLFLIGKGKAKLAKITESLIAEDITIAAWEEAMRTAISDQIIGAGVLAAGGEANLTPEIQSVIADAIAAQDKYLTNYAAQLTSRNLSIGTGLINRSEL